MSIQSNINQGLSIAAFLMQRSPIGKHRSEKKMEAETKAKVSELENIPDQTPEERQESMQEAANIYREHYHKTGRGEALLLSREYNKRAAEAGKEVERRKQAEEAARDALEARRLEQEKSNQIRSMILEGVPSDTPVRERIKYDV